MTAGTSGSEDGDAGARPPQLLGDASVTARPASWTALAMVAWLFAGCIVIQVFLAGLGVFDSPERFLTHRNFGYLFGWLSLVALLIAAIGRLPRRLIGLAGLTLVQMALQSVLILFREDAPALAALHPVNGVLLLVTTLVLGRLAWRGPQTQIPPATATTATTASGTGAS
jgi:mercuric ion transport protein